METMLQWKKNSDGEENDTEKQEQAPLFHK